MLEKLYNNQTTNKQKQQQQQQQQQQTTNGTCYPGVTILENYKSTTLAPRPLPDFVSQLWRKIRRRPGIIAMSWVGNGGHG